MALSNNDLKKIGNLIQAGYEYLDAKWDKRFIQLELKFDEHTDENNKQFKIINSKLDQIIKTENEDILAVFNDFQNVKTRLKKANI